MPNRKVGGRRFAWLTGPSAQAPNVAHFSLGARSNDAQAAPFPLIQYLPEARPHESIHYPTRALEHRAVLVAAAVRGFGQRFCLPFGPLDADMDRHLRCRFPGPVGTLGGRWPDRGGLP